MFRHVKGERLFCEMLQAELENQCQCRMIEGRTKLTAVPGDPFPLGLLPEVERDPSSCNP
jgi:hypothetical protein